MISLQFSLGLLIVSLAVSTIALICDFKWREYPKWAYYMSLLLVGFFWYLFMREVGWLANLQQHAAQIVIVVIGLIFVFYIGAFIGSLLHGVKFGGGDVKFMAVLSLLLPITPVWFNHSPIFPLTGQGIQYVEYMPIDFWVNTILFWGVFILILTLFATLARKPEGSYVVPLVPVIIAAFYLTIWYGGIWRGVVEPIIPIIKRIIPVILGG